MYTILRPTIVLTDHSIHSRINLRVSNGATDLSDLSGDTKRIFFKYKLITSFCTIKFQS